jgi:predicted nucleic acid-binding protein
MSQPPRAVLDTQVWVFVFEHEVLDDFNSKQPFRAILEALERGDFIPVHSHDSLDELHCVLTESKAVAQRFNIDRKLAEYFIEAVSSSEISAVVVDIDPPPYVSSDPDDDYIIETAVAGKARYLVSEDAHLHEPAVIEHLRQRGISVVYPKQFRKILEAAS